MDSLLDTVLNTKSSYMSQLASQSCWYFFKSFLTFYSTRQISLFPLFAFITFCVFSIIRIFFSTYYSSPFMWAYQNVKSSDAIMSSCSPRVIPATAPIQNPPRINQLTSSKQNEPIRKFPANLYRTKPQQIVLIHEDDKEIYI